MRTIILMLTFTLVLIFPFEASRAQQDQATDTPTMSSTPISTTTPDQPEGEATQGVRITFPQAGEALQGVVSIQGRTSVDDFLSAELSFSYVNDPTGTWFLIGQNQETVEDGLLARWDTTTITDGQYDLLLTVFLSSGESTTFIVEDIRVRNYTPVETDTPVPSGTPETREQPTSTPTSTSTNTLEPGTPTPFPTNPAQLTTRDIASGLGKGALGVVAAFAVMGLYASIKKALRR